jgi:hypothetical protein
MNHAKKQGRTAFLITALTSIIDLTPPREPANPSTHEKSRKSV